RPHIDYTKHHGLAVLAAHMLPAIGRLIPFRTLAAWYERIQRRGTQGQYLFVSNEQPHPRYWGLQYEARMYQPGHTGVLHGKEFPIPADPDSWLRMSYGDYMQLPPEHQRVPQHVQRLEEGGQQA
ncbi:MAG: hypothetical protein ACI4MK_15255, partial [Aristaeellaceae bacterium]